MRLVEPGSPKDSRRLPKLGVVLLIFCALLLTISLSGFGWLASHPGLVLIGFMAFLLVTGIGLIRSAIWARWLAAAFFLLLLLGQLWSLGEFFLDVYPLLPFDVGTCLWVLNALLTSGLFAWLMVRTLQTLRNPERRESPWTVRLTGLLLLSVAIAHIQLATAAGGMVSGMAMSLSAEGVKWIGFRGWPLFHIGLALVAAALLLGNPRIKKLGAAGLVFLFSLSCPLIVWASFDMASRMGDMGLQLLLFFVVLVGLVVYLSWWLLHELEGSWATLGQRDFRISLSLGATLLLVIAMIGGSKIHQLNSFEDRLEGSKDELEEMFEEMRAAEEAKYQAAGPLDSSVLPTIQQWMCAEDGDERCDRSVAACQAHGQSHCVPSTAVWCFTMPSESGARYQCYIDEGACRWNQDDYSEASRCGLVGAPEY